MKTPYTLQNAIESVLSYVKKIDLNGWCICQSEFDDCLNDQDRKDKLVQIVSSRFEYDVCDGFISKATFKTPQAIGEDWEDRWGACCELDRHSYYSNEIFCEYFQKAFPYILKNDRSLLDQENA
jgi:hypothetical protein